MKPTLKFQSVIHDEVVEISLQGKRGLLERETTIPVSEWQAALPEESLPILAVVEALKENYSCTQTDNKIVLPHEAVTKLSEAQAHLLGLPQSIPFAFDIKTSGTIDQSDFKISVSWVNAGGVREFSLRNKGAFAWKGNFPYRIPSPIYEIVKASAILTENTNSEEERYKALAALQELIPNDNSETRVRSDRYLGSIRILHASAFSLQIPTGGDGFQFNPVLFSRKAIGRAEDDNRILDESENLLTENLQSVFANDRFKRWPNARDCYAVDQGIYVYLDKDLKKALEVVRKIQQADPEERKKFIRTPQKYIQEQIGESFPFDVVERLFVETEQYAANVLGLGLWEPPVLPWIIREPNSWLPEKFGIKIGNIYIQIESKEDIPGLRERAQEAFESGVNTILEYGDNIIPLTPEVASALIGSLDKLGGIALPSNVEAKTTVENVDDALPEKPVQENIHFLIVQDNFEDLGFQAQPARRTAKANYSPPSVLKSTLKAHQQTGFEWLINAWTEGAPGVLLADDMGLGKTLQALTFLAWLRERKKEGYANCKEPVLIVAPTGLLNNWIEEINIHLHSPGLGSICKVFGINLANLKATKENDLRTGQTNLNRDELRRSDVVLTTYETYRDYHHSLGGIRFSAVVMDEVQKIKNPKSQVNRALASMNAEFVITMTGTPVENSLEDLWTIMDRAWPGFLGNLKDFSTTYAPDDHQALARLTQKLKGRAANDVSVPVLFRRMKHELPESLPEKIIHAEYVDMPKKQAEAYLEIVERAREKEPPPMLHTLHCLRGVSLHPTDPNIVISEGNFSSYDEYIRDSARLKKAFEILDTIKNKNEKALIFMESLDMQLLVAQIVKKRYGLTKLPSIINGKTGVDRIQRHKNEFQADPNFDVMILSPKVGGVGLTLTAANHVIHLSRWWNPAVEDQSTDRVYRIGQKKNVHVYYPIAVHPDTAMRDHSFDLKLNALLERKRKLSRDMLLPAESKGDTEALFKDTVGFKNEPQTITIEELDKLGHEGFEKWVLNRARQSGYIADETLTSWDFGADGIIVHKETKQKFILQCKHSLNPQIHQDVVQELLQARAAYDSQGNAGLIAITNSRFAPILVRKMEEFGIRFFDRDTIVHWPRL